MRPTRPRALLVQASARLYAASTRWIFRDLTFRGELGAVLDALRGLPEEFELSHVAVDPDYPHLVEARIDRVDEDPDTGEEVVIACGRLRITLGRPVHHARRWSTARGRPLPEVVTRGVPRAR